MAERWVCIDRWNHLEIQNALRPDGVSSVCDMNGSAWNTRPNTPKLAGWERVVVIVQKLLAIERLETLQDPVSDPTCPNGANNFTLKIKGVPGDVSYFPVSAFDHLVSGHEVPDEKEDRHHDVFCDGRDIGPSHFQDLNLFVDGCEHERITLDSVSGGACEMVLACIQIDVVTANTSRNAKFQVLSLAGEEVGDVCLRVDG